MRLKIENSDTYVHYKNRLWSCRWTQFSVCSFWPTWVSSVQRIRRERERKGLRGREGGRDYYEGPEPRERERERERDGSDFSRHRLGAAGSPAEHSPVERSLLYVYACRLVPMAMQPCQLVHSSKLIRHHIQETRTKPRATIPVPLNRRQHKTTDLNSKPTNCFLDRCCDLLNHFTILKFGCWIWLLLQRWEFIKQWSLLYFLFSGPGTWYKTWKTTVFLVFLFLCALPNIEWTNSTRT